MSLLVNKRFLGYANIIKWFEYLLLSVFFVLSFWLLYSNSCSGQSCRDFAPSRQIFFLSVQGCFIIWGVLNSLRIAFTFAAYDHDAEPDILFYTSLVGLTLCFSVLGLFFQEFEEFSRRAIASSWPFLVELVLILTTALAFFQEKYIWEKANSFVKIRVGLSFIHLIVLLVNPLIGGLLSLVIFPIMVFWPVNTPKS